MLDQDQPPERVPCTPQTTRLEGTPRCHSRAAVLVSWVEKEWGPCGLCRAWGWHSRGPSPGKRTQKDEWGPGSPCRALGLFTPKKRPCLPPLPLLCALNPPPPVPRQLYLSPGRSAGPVNKTNPGSSILQNLPQNSGIPAPLLTGGGDLHRVGWRIKHGHT